MHYETRMINCISLLPSSISRSSFAFALLADGSQGLLAYFRKNKLVAQVSGKRTLPEVGDARDDSHHFLAFLRLRLSILSPRHTLHGKLPLYLTIFLALHPCLIMKILWWQEGTSGLVPKISRTAAISDATSSTASEIHAD